MKDFLGNLWFGFVILGALIGGAAPFVMIGYFLYILLE